MPRSRDPELDSHLTISSGPPETALYPDSIASHRGCAMASAFVTQLGSFVAFSWDNNQREESRCTLQWVMTSPLWTNTRGKHR